MAVSSAPPQPSTSTEDSDDAFYTVNRPALQKLRESRPWHCTGSSFTPTSNNPTHFQSVSLSPSSLVKISDHCQSGVTKGLKQGTKPIEVMGLLMGRPDPTQPTRIIITDAFPLPIEGFETRVIADDDSVINHMIKLGESLESSREEKLCGWYHSHPFDPNPSGDSHCFLSTTDLSTQLGWQRSEDPHGNCWLALVVDPQLTLKTKVPQIKAFRAYPPEYKTPVLHQCPDGRVIKDEKKRLELWGAAWDRYYTLNVQYYMSSLASEVMGIMTGDSVWVKRLGFGGEDRTEDKVMLEVEKIKEIDERLGGLFRGGEILTSRKGKNEGGGGSAGESARDEGGEKTEGAMSLVPCVVVEARAPLSYSQASKVLYEVELLGKEAKSKEATIEVMQGTFLGQKKKTEVVK